MHINHDKNCQQKSSFYLQTANSKHISTPKSEKYFPPLRYVRILTSLMYEWSLEHFHMSCNRIQAARPAELGPRLLIKKKQQVNATFKNTFLFKLHELINFKYKPSVYSADIVNLGQGFKRYDGFGVFDVPCGQVNQDLTEMSRHLTGLLITFVIIRQQFHHIFQHMCHCRRSTDTHLKCDWLFWAQAFKILNV